ncbi:MAG: hypothetical protein Q9187_007676 [Circinaria calcarea]
MSPATALYNAALLPPSLETGTRYPKGPNTTHASLSAIYDGPSLTSLAQHAPRWDPVLEAATAHLEAFSYPVWPCYGPEALEALTRLSCLQTLGDDWGPDIVYKVFEDLDDALFDGRLRGRCSVRWKKEEELQALFPGVGDKWGTTDYSGWFIDDLKTRQVIQTHIYLNATLHFLNPLATHADHKGEMREHSRWEEMWGTLLHEMCHAYLRLVTSANLRVWMWSEGPDKYHGSHFQRCLKAVNGRSGEVLGIMGIGTTEENVGCCGERGESCADETHDDDLYDDEEWGEEEYNEEEYDEEEWNEEELTEEEGKTTIGDEAIFDSNPTGDESTDGAMSGAKTREVESPKGEVKPQQEEIKAEQEQAKIEVMEAVPKPKAPPAPITWANWGGRLLENVELRHVSRDVSTGKQVGEVGKVEVKKEVEMKQVEVEVKKAEVERKKAEMVTWTWANWNGRLLEN